MTKDISQRSNLILTIDKSLVDALGIDENSELEMLVVDDSLIIRPRGESADRASKKRREALAKSAASIIKTHKTVFEKLAKT